MQGHGSRLARRWALMVFILLAACSAPPVQPNSSGSYEGTALNQPAPEFRLTDQAGKNISLTDMRGSVVVLAFMESECEEVCPATAAHLRSTYQALGKESSRVVFLGLNVNTQANAVTDVLAATQRWSLDTIPTWHFLTGSPADLEAAWTAYHIYVQPALHKGDELMHTPGVYVIDASGRERWFIDTAVGERDKAQWIPEMSDLLIKHIRQLLAEG